MKTGLIVAMALVMSTGFALAKQPKRWSWYPSVCYKTAGEEYAGMNKICHFDCSGNRAAITISAVSLCPLSIKNRYGYANRRM